MKRKAVIVVSLLGMLFQVSCVTNKEESAPPRDEISSMPHNIPQSWEGSAGFPGGGGMGAY